MAAFLAAGAGIALAFVAYRMMQENKPPPQQRMMQNNPIKDPKHYVANGDATKVKEVIKSVGRYGLPRWDVHYVDGTVTQLFTPPEGLTMSVGPAPSSRTPDMAKPLQKKPTTLGLLSRGSKAVKVAI
jgi:hypothetical protein